MRPALPGNGPPLLVGRSRERSLLHAQLSEALAGQGGLVILSGEAGIGGRAAIRGWYIAGDDGTVYFDLVETETAHAAAAKRQEHDRSDSPDAGGNPFWAYPVVRSLRASPQ